MSNRVDLTIAQGDTIAEAYQITNVLTDAPPSATLTTVEVLVKTSLGDADAAALLTRRSTDSAQVEITDAALWKFTVKATTAETAALTAGHKKWVCTTISADGTVEAWRGNFIIRPRAGDPSS